MLDLLQIFLCDGQFSTTAIQMPCVYNKTLNILGAKKQSDKEKYCDNHKQNAPLTTGATRPCTFYKTKEIFDFCPHNVYYITNVQK